MKKIFEKKTHCLTDDCLGGFFNLAEFFYNGSLSGD